jgi:16S rRNA (cytosine967-C5)-methyltransferase
MGGSKTGAWQRAEAARVVDSVVAGGRSLDAALAAAEERINPDDRPLVRLLCYGALRNHWRLKSQLGGLLDRSLKKSDRVIESLLLVGLYQLTDTRVPDHAAVSMTVEAARLLRKPKYAGLVNAILRNFVRRNLADAEPGDDESRYNHPGWLIDAIRRDWPERWKTILAANNDRAPMWLRVSPAAGDALSYLRESGLEGSPQPGLPQAVRLAAPRPVDDLPGFAEGLVSVQDAAAQIAATWLLASDGQRVLDACAAPGGKTGHLLELIGPGADVTAIDADESRLEVLTENLARLGLCATVITADASNPKEWWDGRPFDRILLDAPCSATGVIRRHPDIKLLRRAGDVEALAAVQRKLLAALWETLAPGGRLLYVTCSVLRAENDVVVTEFLASQADAREDRVLHDYNIRDLMCERASGFQVLPGTEGMDGFYFACLEKAKPE